MIQHFIEKEVSPSDQFLRDFFLESVFMINAMRNFYENAFQKSSYLKKIFMYLYNLFHQWRLGRLENFLLENSQKILEDGRQCLKKKFKNLGQECEENKVHYGNIYFQKYRKNRYDAFARFS